MLKNEAHTTAAAMQMMQQCVRPSKHAATLLYWSNNGTAYREYTRWWMASKQKTDGQTDRQQGALLLDYRSCNTISANSYSQLLQHLCSTKIKNKCHTKPCRMTKSTPMWPTEFSTIWMPHDGITMQFSEPWTNKVKPSKAIRSPQMAMHTRLCYSGLRSSPRMLCRWYKLTTALMGLLSKYIC